MKLKTYSVMLSLSSILCRTDGIKKLSKTMSIIFAPFFLKIYRILICFYCILEYLYKKHLKGIGA